MSARRNERLLKETLGEEEGGMPDAEGLLPLVSLVMGLLAFIAVWG